MSPAPPPDVEPADETVRLSRALDGARRQQWGLVWAVAVLIGIAAFETLLIVKLVEDRNHLITLIVHSDASLSRVPRSAPPGVSP